MASSLRLRRRAAAGRNAANLNITERKRQEKVAVRRLDAYWKQEVL